jgi:membrane protease YdiL (CAAX protease family)
MLIAFTIAGLLVATAISVPLWTAMTGKPFENLAKQFSDPANGAAARMIQAVQAVFGFLLPAVLTAFLLNRKPFRLLGFSSAIKFGQAAIVVFIMIAAMFVSASLSYFNDLIPLPEDLKQLFDRWELEYNDQVTAIIGLNNAGEYLLAIIIMAFLPALGEEALFRGGLQNFLTRSSRMPWLAIIIVSIIFSAVHFSWYGFLPRFFLGIVLGCIYYYSGNLWLSIWGHFLNNAIAITAIYVSRLQGKSVKESINPGDASMWWLLLLPVVMILLILFRRMSFGSVLYENRTGVK